VSSSLLDRLMRPVRPGPIPGFAPPPRELAPGLWRVDRKLRMPGGLVLPVSATLLRLPDGSLLVHAPVPIDGAGAQAIRAIGPVSAVLAPNSFHHLFVADYLARFEGAALFLAPGLRERIPSLPVGTVVAGEPPVSWQGAVEPIPFGPIGPFGELAIFHPSTATLVLTDLAFHMRTFESAFDRIGWRLFGVPSEFGPSRSARLTLLRDARAARPFLERMLEKGFRRVLVAHGEALEVDAEQQFRRAFRAYLEVR
jgi:hypothetical protein